jgi:hypothetical protein
MTNWKYLAQNAGYDVESLLRDGFVYDPLQLSSLESQIAEFSARQWEASYDL